MSNIILHQFGSVAVGFDAKDGFIDATAMSSAYKEKTGKRKDPQHWVTTKQAQEYTKFVSEATGIPVADLIVTRNGVGTWIHPDLAVAYGTWLSPEYQYIVTKVIQDWHERKSLKQFPQAVTGALPASPAEQLCSKASIAIDIFFPHIAVELRTGMKIEAVAKIDPELGKMLEGHKPKLLLDSPLLSPTELGALMDPPLPARAVNKLLCDRNLQAPTGEKNPGYKLIGSGNEFGKVVADTARGHGKTVQHVRWYESVMDLLR
jgi:KilA-N domain